MTLLIVDSTTWTITLLGWGIVFAALLFLVGVFIMVPIIINWVSHRTLKVVENGKEVVKESRDMTGETNAVIAAALHMFLNESHEEESGIITIKQVQKRYSPWNSKLYGMTNLGFSDNISKQKR